MFGTRLWKIVSSMHNLWCTHYFSKGIRYRKRIRNMCFDFRHLLQHPCSWQNKIFENFPEITLFEQILFWHHSSMYSNKSTLLVQRIVKFACTTGQGVKMGEYLKIYMLMWSCIDCYDARCCIYFCSNSDSMVRVWYVPSLVTFTEKDFFHNRDPNSFSFFPATQCFSTTFRSQLVVFVCIFNTPSFLATFIITMAFHCHQSWRNFKINW